MIENGHAKILIVEDEQIIGMHLSRVVKNLGYDVIGLENSGEAAIQKFNEKMPDMMLVDIGLKGKMTGIDLVKKIKETEDLPVIFLSSSTDDDQIHEAENTFPSAYIQKPFDEKQLATTLKISLSRFQKQKEEFNKLVKDVETKEINIKELSETNAHLITATWRERELKNELQKTKEIIEVQNKKILDSINYAKRIQSCTAPSENLMDECLKNYFLFYKPKDVVSGDFPWLYDRGEYIYYAAVDCTGHGVPGAMMSMIGNLLLNDVVNNELKMKTPAEMLAELHSGVVKTLKQDDPDNKAADGMDIALCRLKRDRSELMFSGAHLPLYLLRGEELIEYKGSRFPVGGVQYRNRNKYNDHIVDVKPGDKVFVFSDGMIDQLGGPENRKLMSTGLKEFIIENAKTPIAELGKKAEEKFYSWMGDNKQIDDVILFGIEI
ncbi:response regulator [Paracrocinitomix mangrovi]|uniref:response regulator n=1 Tax=Paracrocinitomix mangrovi TaxID=2862509 RepID=UPI001C8DA119|nr:response regulator [Paracrocinitomix mangrovi]UKN01607.1 response regulator [Paracrocinitomix mangrovi]